ncbi:Eukaryotic translation initiation factor 3 subunit C [Rhynchospora pubera]|uniref:Eukaryotic translation initiation factor 3 subunit C n=1 Tax=Rhynchospora pubera TaxID=906938 RepID=A0AAV8EGG8_9POAL|nr:Eukaryotic translation initiation factor 3 subunit C [Rhynchospora pubera]
MEQEKENSADQVEEIQPESSSKRNPNPKSVHIKTPEVEVRLYRRGRGPVEVFKSRLGGWDQNQLEVGDILEKCGLKSLYAFNPEEGTRGVSIRFNAKNGRSMLPYTDGAVVYIDGEPKDSMVMPVTKVLVAVTLLTLLIAIFLKETPDWLSTSKLSNLNFPPWVLACIVIAFTRLRKRTKDVLKKFGW